MPKMTKEIIQTRAKYEPSSIREDDKSVEFVLATDNPALMYKSGLGYVNESLVAKGAVYPRESVPILNCHDRYSIDKILGSVREMKTEGEKLIGRLFFADTEEGTKAFELVKSGHLATGSVGYYRIKSIWIEENQSTEFNGKTYNGPLLLTTEWGLDEFSLVPVPADEDATVRGKNDNGFGVIEKNKKELDIMPTKTNEEQQVQVEVAEKTETVIVENNGETLEKARQEAGAEACKRERERIIAINQVCEKFDCKDIATRAINENLSVDETNKLVLEKLSRNSVPLSQAKSNITIVEDEKDKFTRAVSDGILLRAGVSLDKPADGAEHFRGFGFENIARVILQRNGDHTIYGKMETLERVMRAGSQSYSDFNYILDTSVKKAVMKGYNSAPATWRSWAAKGTLDDLEAANRVGLNDIPELDKYEEGSEIKSKTLSDKGEQVQLDTYANKLILTRRAILADNMGLFNKIAVRIGLRCAQKIEKLAYAALTSNPTMSDGNAVFSAAHHNLLTGAALSKDSLSAAYTAMRKQQDENGSKLDLKPRFLLVCPDDEVTADVLTTSINDVSSIFTMGPTNTFKKNGLVAISSAFLETSNGFYLIADPADCDTVEVDFLDGKETPTVTMADNENDILCRSWKYVFDVAAKAIDFRGMTKTPPTV